MYLRKLNVQEKEEKYVRSSMLLLFLILSTLVEWMNLHPLWVDICCQVEIPELTPCVVSECEGKLLRGKMLIYLSHITIPKFAFII